MKRLSSSTHPKKILIVEDEEDMRQALVEELDRAGFEVVEAKNGKEGLAAAARDRPDLILLDIIMPGMDGMVVMKNIREHPWGKTIPIILLTNLSVTEKILEGIVKDEPSYYLVKSDWKIGEIITKIKERLAHVSR